MDKLTPAWSISNKGLRLELPVSPNTDRPYALLQCRTSHAPASILAVPLVLVLEGTYARANIPVCLFDHGNLLQFKSVTFYALLQVPPTRKKISSTTYPILMRTLPPLFKVVDAWTMGSESWIPGSQTISRVHFEKNFRAAVLLESTLPINKECVVLIVSCQMQVKTLQAALEGTQQPTIWPLQPTCYLVKHDDGNQPSRVRWEQFTPIAETCARDTYESDDDVIQELFSKLGTNKSLLPRGIRTFDGEYYAVSATSEDLFEERALCIDFSLITILGNAVQFIWEAQLLSLRYSVGVRRWFARHIWWLLATPPVLVLAIKMLSRKASHPSYLFPCMMLYACLSSDDKAIRNFTYRLLQACAGRLRLVRGLKPIM